MKKLLFVIIVLSLTAIVGCKKSTDSLVKTKWINGPAEAPYQTLEFKTTDNGVYSKHDSDFGDYSGEFRYSYSDGQGIIYAGVIDDLNHTITVVGNELVLSYHNTVFVRQKK